jgi:transposase
VAASHQVADIPPETATVTQHDLHEVTCRCGRVHRAPAPAGAGTPGTVTYGLALQAWCVYLIAAHAIPVHRCVELIEALTGTGPSPGFVHSMIARAAAAVAEANRAIRCLIILAHVISADETPVRAGPGPKARKRYLLVACTHPLTYHFLGDRSLKTFTAFVLPDIEGTVVVHDWYQNYDAILGLIHQLCAHILRDLAGAAETYPGAHWPVQASQALQGPIHAANAARAQGLPAIPDDIAVPLTRAFRHGVLVGLSELPRVAGRKQRPCRDLLECLRDRQADVLRFTTDLRIPPTSDQPERDLRPAKISAEDFRPAPLRAGHPAPVRHPRLHLHRRQAWRPRPDRHPPRPRRHPLDAAHPRPAVNPAAPHHPGHTTHPGRVCKVFGVTSSSVVTCVPRSGGRRR